MSSQVTTNGTAAAALNLVGHLVTLLVNKKLITRAEFEELVNASASDDETRKAIQVIWNDVV